MSEELPLNCTFFSRALSFYENLRKYYNCYSVSDFDIISYVSEYGAIATSIFCILIESETCDIIKKNSAKMSRPFSAEKDFEN